VQLLKIKYQNAITECYVIVGFTVCQTNCDYKLYLVRKSMVSYRYMNSETAGFGWVSANIIQLITLYDVNMGN